MTMTEKILIGICAPILVMMAYVVFIMVPVMMYAESECLRAGYPKYYVSVGLERYCSNLDGAVTVKVTKANGK